KEIAQTSQQQMCRAIANSSSYSKTSPAGTAPIHRGAFFTQICRKMAKSFLISIELSAHPVPGRLTLPALCPPKTMLYQWLSKQGRCLQDTSRTDWVIIPGYHVKVCTALP